MDEVRTTYVALMEQHNVDLEVVTRKVLKMKVSCHIKDIEFFKSPRVKEPERLCSVKTTSGAVDDFVKHQDDAKDMQIIYESSKIIRQAILEEHRSHPWKFDGSLSKPNEIPVALTNILRWIIAGPATKLLVGKKEKTINKSVQIIAQSIMYATKSNRQIKYKPVTGGEHYRNMNENPQVLGLGLAVHHTTRSKYEIDLLHNFGYSLIMTTFCG